MTTQLGLSVSAAARRLGICDDTCRTWFDTGRLAGYRTATGFRRILLDDETLKEEHLTVSDAARLLGVCKETVRARFDDGRLQGYRLATGHRRIARSSIERIVKGRR